MSFEEYLEWAEKSLEVQMHHKISICELGNNERGVFCQTQISAEEPILSIPFSALLTIYHVLHSCPEIQTIAMSGVREEDLLILMLLFEKHVRGENSRWSKHISLLPRQYNSALFFTPEVLQALEGSNLAIIATRIQAQAQQDFEELLQKKVGNGEFTVQDTFDWLTFEEYKWALSTIWSRFVTINRQGEQIKTMVPVFDMLNHSPTAAMMHGYQDSNDSFHLVTFQEWSAESEVFINYGPFSNSKLFWLYGFVLENNPFDAVDLWATMIEEEELNYSIKQEVLSSYGIVSNQLPFQLRKGEIPQALLGALRVQRATSEDLPKLNTAFDSILSLENENLVIQDLKAFLQSAIDAFPTSLEEDETILQTNNETPSLGEVEVMAIILRKGEKEILHSVLDLLEQYEINIFGDSENSDDNEEKESK